MKILSFILAFFQEKKNQAKELFERKKTVPHKTVHYDWQLKENYEYLTGKKLQPIQNYNRDSLSYAIKASCDNKESYCETFKNPIKYDGIKKSSKGAGGNTGNGGTDRAKKTHPQRAFGGTAAESGYCQSIGKST